VISLKINQFIFENFSSQKDYKAPFIWARFEVLLDTMVNIECRALAENIEYERLNRRGLTKFTVYVAKSKSRKKTYVDV
jgi:hypothetical protein